MTRSKTRRIAVLLTVLPMAVFSAWALSQCAEDLSSILPEVDAGGEVQACTNNAQCGKDKVCINKVCVAPGEGDAGEKTCQSRLECGPDQDCVGGWCVPAEGDAQVTGDGGEDTGLPNGDGSVCTNSASCGSGYRCNPETHACESAAVINVDPAELDFGAVPFGNEVTRTASVSNTGTADLKVLSADFDQGTNPDPQNPVFRKTTSTALPVTLKPGEQMTIDVICRQNDARPDNGGLLVTSTDLDRPLTRIPLLSRYKGVPDVAIVDRNASPPAVLYPKSGSTDEYGVNVGNVAIGGSRETTVTLMNATTGDAILAIDQLDIHKKTDNEFTITFRDTADVSNEREVPIYLSPGDMVDMVVGYAPLVKTADERTDLDLRTNDDDINNDGTGGSSVLFVKLTAKAGWEPGGISVSKGQIQFGEVQINTTASDAVGVCNSGGSNLSILPTSGLQTPQTAFSTAPQSLAKTLAPLECFDVTVSFSPTKLGDAANVLVLNSDDPGTPSVSIPLSGTGTDPTISLFPKDISFSNAFVGVPANPVNVVITNTGSGILTVTSIELTAGSSSDFKVTNKPPQLPATLHENQADSISFTVEFTATVNGVISGAVQVENSDADNPRAIV
ncbi:MAG: choice-of-anchor D domain-containing protein, partial [Deltaproteobacteria bacterium]|nr:choice-of-anchor D domain-containing protein [Deltaproteobacteria bacterium]